jgi:C-terminal peptidase prc
LKKFSIFFRTAFVSTLVSLALCSPSSAKKTNTQNIPFGEKDFANAVKTVKENYIDKNIDENRAYTDAAIFAMLSMPHPLYIFPESFYNERENYEEKDDLLPGKTFKLSEADQFLIFDPDYKKIDEMRKAKQKLDEKKPKLTNEELKKYVEREQNKKQVLASRFEQINFGKKEFDRVIVFIEANLHKYKTPPIKEANEVTLDEEEQPKEEFSIKDIYLGAANGFLNSLDPHSNVFMKSAWEKSMRQIEDSSFEGIGAILSGGGNKEIVVENPLEDKPAVKAGIRAGDMIVGVDGKSTKGVMLDRVVKSIKGKKGTSVVLTLKRKGTPKNFDISVVRANIEIKNIAKKLIKDNEHIGYIKLTGFIRTEKEDASDVQFKNAYKELEQQALAKNMKLKGLIVDLRNNAGGYLDLAVNISDFFVPKDLVIVSTKGNSPMDHEEKKAVTEKKLTDLPVIVLINAKSASASEIVASAVKAHGRGLLLGERTFGKATVQKLMPFPENPDYLIKITQSRYYSPSGRTIQVVGVQPDIEVSAELDGSFPFQYREENMWQHLPKIPAETTTDKQFFDLNKLKNYVAKNGKSESYLKEHKNDPIKPDFQLIRSLDYMEALIQTKK